MSNFNYTDDQRAIVQRMVDELKVNYVHWIQAYNWAQKHNVDIEFLKTAAERHGLQYKLLPDDVAAGLAGKPQMELIPATDPITAAVKDELTPKQVGRKVGRVLSDLPDNLVPSKDPIFVKFGIHDDVLKAVQSRRFTTIWIDGESGYGKTTTVEQACALAGREYVEVTITEETKETDLLGDFRLIDGETRYYYGPVVEAALRGAVLLLDELPKADPRRIMCLQKILMGKPFFIKKTGEMITPKAGFMIIATGNSKGNGDETNGRYLTDQTHDEAFKDRFHAYIHQDPPPANVEERILRGYLKDNTNEFSKNLVNWANITRTAYNEGRDDYMITTRRLIAICGLYNIYGDKVRAIEMGVGRFTKETADSLRTAYFAVDESVDPKRIEEKAKQAREEAARTAREEAARRKAAEDAERMRKMGIPTPNQRQNTPTPVPGNKAAPSGQTKPFNQFGVTIGKKPTF